MLVTARECFQVPELASLLRVDCKCIGHHYGKSRVLKAAGLCVRTIQLAPTVIRERPNIALSHGSRSQILLAALLGIPSLVIFDYEFAKGLKILHPTWLMTPDVIADGTVRPNKYILKYPGIKEDVYLPTFRPDSAIRAELGIQDSDFVVTLRPPANEAHYHNPESDTLLEAVLRLLNSKPNIKVILLPRNKKQDLAIRRQWQEQFAAGKILVPAQAVNGLNLIWHSELVISGGGTMNREAAALGVPVYSIFRGPIGAVDRYLSARGRLVLLESTEDVMTKLVLQRRDHSVAPERGNVETLRRISDNIIAVMDSPY